MFGRYEYTSHVIALHQYRAIYMAVPKVANTSVKTALTSLMPTHIRELPKDGRKERSVYALHNDVLFRDKIRLYKHQVPQYSDYLVFAFVRNPWDRLVSCYRDKIEWGALVEDGKRRDPRTRRLYLGRQFERDMDFAEFVQRVVEIPDRRANRHIRSQFTFLADKSGELLPNFIGRFETLTDDFSAVMKRIGAPHLTLPHLRNSAPPDYRKYYTERLAELVADRYRRDIELFDYSF
jgi:hypothetical protein